MAEHFPPIRKDVITYRSPDRNPAIQVFGRRFFVDQTVPELLLELLLVAASAKRVWDTEYPDTAILPDIELLRNWPRDYPLEYAAKARINLKLFSFLGSSKLETRHKTHRRHYRDLLSALTRRDRLTVSGGTEKHDVLKTLENLFLGFQGVGVNRTWCAQSFLPVARPLIAGESIWRETKASRDQASTWEDALAYFTHSQQVFLARGGELLYLQICNALRKDERQLLDWSRAAGLGLVEREHTPIQLYTALSQGLASIIDACPDTIGKLAEFIDTGVDAETSAFTDWQRAQRRFTTCGWCPEESWHEGLLFAVELLRVSEAMIDPLERIEMLEIACALQVLRSLCAQSVRYNVARCDGTVSAGLLGYVWALSDPEGRDGIVKQVSRRSVSAVERLIHDAVRHPDILATIKQQKESDERQGKLWRDPYGDADSRYGHKLFVTLAKRIGLMVPKRGAGARFVLNERLLRFLVFALVRPGERMTYETFKDLLFAHYGIAVDDRQLSKACEWCGTSRLSTLGGTADAWLTEMLDASGMLLRLSDSCSLVCNPFGKGEVSP